MVSEARSARLPTLAAALAALSAVFNANTVALAPPITPALIPLPTPPVPTASKVSVPAATAIFPKFWRPDLFSKIPCSRSLLIGISLPCGLISVLYCLVRFFSI